MPTVPSILRHDPPVGREADSRCRSLLDSLGQACVALDATFQVLYCNPAYAALAGLPVEALAGQSLPVVLPRFVGSTGERACTQALATGVRQEAEEIIGERFYLSRVYPTPEGVLIVIDDVTPRRQLEEELVHIAMRGRLVLEQVPAIQWTVDRDLRFTLSMGGGLKDLGLKPGGVVGLTLQDYFRTEDADNPQIRKHREALDGRRVSYATEHAGRAYDCTLEPLRDHDGRIVGVIGVAHDVTERRRAEEERRRLEQQVHRTQKLESLGLLAGGVAHDFNNLLVGILGTAEVLLRDLPAGSPHRSLVELVKKAGENAAQLTRQMLVYAGKGPSARRPLDLNTLIREGGSLVSAAVRKNIALETSLSPELLLVQADPGQLQQVILNLILNAAEAIGLRPGRITLSTGVQPIAEADRERDLPPGRYAYVEVVDDGCGMAPEVAARIFDPFFTTKASGRGLGMAVVQGIVHAHQGGIRVRSKPDEGTTFRVFLPAQPLATP